MTGKLDLNPFDLTIASACWVYRSLNSAQLRAFNVAGQTRACSKALRSIFFQIVDVVPSFWL